MAFSSLPWSCPRTALALAVGLSTVSCGSSPEPTPAPTPPSTSNNDRIDFALGARTRLLDAEALAALQPGADTSRTLRFTTAVGSRFARGDVLLAPVSERTPRGLLRVVRSAQVVGDLVELETEQAPLQLAFSRLHAHVERTLPVSPPPSPPRLGTQAGFTFGGTETIDQAVFDGDGDPKTLEDQLYLHDRFDGQMGVALDIDFDWGIAETLVNGVDDFLECVVTLGFSGDCPDLDLPELKASVQAGASVAAKFDHAGAAAAAYEHGPFTVGDVTSLPAITIGPLVILPELTFQGKTRGRAGSYARLAGRSETGFELHASISTSSGVDAGATPTKSFQLDAVEAFLDGHVETAVGPELRMLAYGAIGPTIGVDFRTVLDVDRTRKDTCYEARLGIDARFGFVVRFPWRALGEKLSGSAEIGEDVEDIASYFGLAGTILSKHKSFPLLDEKVGEGPCTNPPPGSLPPGTPQDDTLANPTFTRWSKRIDDPGITFPFAATPHYARARLVLGVDGHYWAVAAPNPTVRRLSIDGKLLSATRYLTRIEDKDVPLPVTDVLARTDLISWVLFEDGTIARLGPDHALIDAFRVQVPFTADETVVLRHGATRPDGRTALLFGIHQISTSYDHRMVLVELSSSGDVLRARAYGAPTSSEVQKTFLTAGHGLYRADGSLVIGGEAEDDTADSEAHCFVLGLGDDGAPRFASKVQAGGGTCAFGALAEAPNGDLLLAGNNGHVFNNVGLLLVLDASGQPKTASTCAFDGQSMVIPTSITRLPSSGYIMAGRDVQSASRDGLFLARLDAQGVPLVAAAVRPPEDVSLGHLDAVLTKDAGLLFGALADWHDLAEQRDLTRFLAGKAHAKDGLLPFASDSGVENFKLEAKGNTAAPKSSPLTYTFSDVTVTLATTPLKVQPLTPVETVFAP